MITFETIATVAEDGTVMVNVPGIAPGPHRITLHIDEEICAAPRFYKGRRVYTEEDCKHLECPFPPEPEWMAEIEKLADERRARGELD